MLPSTSSCCHLVLVAGAVSRTAALGIPINQNASLAGGVSTDTLTIPPNSVRHCTNDAGWVGPSSFDHHFASDCAQTYEMVHREYERHSPYAQFEFLPFGAAQAHPQLQPMYTPRRYTHGSCTTAVVNLKDVPAHYVPDAQGPFVGSALARFYRIIYQWQEVSKCWAWPATQVGWIAIDYEGELGIMQFGARSPLSRDLPRGTNP